MCISYKYPRTLLIASKTRIPVQNMSRGLIRASVLVALFAIIGQCTGIVHASTLQTVVETQNGTVIINEGESPVGLAEIFKNQSTWFDPPVEVLIVTSNALSQEFEPLANLKTRRGTYTEILTIETIEANATLAGAGRDRAERIRNAIKYYHDEKGTVFVILGGDVSVVPTRYVYNPDTTESYFSGDLYSAFKPTDHYYACLEGTWDGDGDGRFGEMNMNSANNTDEIDWTADVYVGRLPVNDALSTGSIVKKIIDYELNPPAGDWYSKAVFAGAVSQYRDDYNKKPAVDEAKLSDFIIDSYFNSMDVQKLYHHTGDYVPLPPYESLNDSSLIDAWNEGSAIINLAGHGDPASFVGRESLSSYISYLNRFQAGALSNGIALPLVYIFSCSSGAFDIKERGVSPMNAGDSLAEELILNPGGGAIGVVSALRTTYYFENDNVFESLNHGQDRFFWREFMINNHHQPGKALYKSLEYYKTQFLDKYWNVDLNRDEELYARENYRPYEEKFRKNILAYNLLGDPEISIYTKQPAGIDTATIPSSMYIGDTVILQPRLTTGEILREGRVLLNGSGYYITASIDARGFACIPVPRDEQLAGTTMSFTISAHNAKQVSTNITITKDTSLPASLSIEFPSGMHDFLEPMTIVSTGVDSGSGLKYAYVIFTDVDGIIDNIQGMKIVSFTGESTRFMLRTTSGLPPGGVIYFYVVAYDASGHFIIIKSSTGQPFSVLMTSRILEDVLIYGAIFGIPAAALAIVAWMLISRKRRSRAFMPFENN